ncbi:MAG: ATP-dependent DNA helicase [Acidobacteriaceae bacterium]|nr:ATP-dependent DNA helicase [Acidobacteriaceae bacterium]
MFRPGGALARVLPGFEPRAGQADMAGRVARLFDSGGVLLAEAGTGTGKTLAYLVPAILSRQRVLVSTGTKNLQEQIFFKDIPTLQAALDVPFTATYMKGRANYLCLHRLDQLNEGRGGAVVHDVFLPIIREWSTTTETGDRAELEDLPEDLPFWSEVAATAETCLGNECPRFDDCFVTRMRQRAAASDIVIVNHHLLCADAAVRQNAYGEVIPSCSHAVVDEAHQLEDIATQYFGYSVSNYRLDEYARDVDRFARAGRIDAEHVTEIEKGLDRLRTHARSFFSELTFAHRANDRARGEERVRVTEASLGATREAAAYLAGALDLVEATLALLAKPASDEEQPAPKEDPATLAKRAGTIRDELRFLLRASDPAYVYFVEFRGKGVFFRASPIDVSNIVNGLLFDRMHATVLTSATLTVDGGFEYIRGRLGIADADTVQLPSEFNFERQAILYLPTRMPDPRSPEFGSAAGREVVNILKRTRGRAFVLFTSYATLRDVQAIAEMALDYPIFVQGTAPRSQLLTQFRETPNSVLLATSSFWQGVDVVGDALSCVIVDKLPFASPGDPITSARIDAVRARGGEPFAEYQVPLAILTLQQGLGRLIRHRQDRGVLAVLDPRLRSKGYGRRFLASMPPAPIVTDLNAVEAFFSIV